MNNVIAGSGERPAKLYLLVAFPTGNQAVGACIGCWLCDLFQ